MKKYLFSLIFVLVSYLGFSQKGLSYQAVILDPNKIEVPGQDIAGQPLVNGDVWIKFSISSGANLQFEEVQKTKTDAYGLVNLLIGSEASSSFNSLVWDASQKNLQVYISFDQGGSYTIVSDQKLSYNPYSFFAETAGKLGATLPISGGGTGATTASDARTNLGLDQVNNTSDAAKPVSTATQTALNLKANSSDMNAALALKANTADMNAALAFKSDTSYVLSKVAAATIADANANTKGKIQLAGDLAGTADAPTVPSLALKLDASQKGAANGVATLNAFGIIPSSQLPAVTISSTSVVGSDAEMIALSNATVGSIAVRTDVNKNYVLSAIPASTLANWIELLTPGAPVQTVNGYTGSVSLVKSDIGLANVDNTSDVNKQVSAATQAALNLKADTASVRTALALKLNMTDANAALNLKLNANKVGVANGTASLNAQGKIPTDQIPAISFSSVKVLGSESDMLALRGAVVGSVVIRTDVNKNYVLAQADPSVLANWIQLLTPAPPVQTVNGYAGNVSITKSDVDLANAENTSDANKPISAATQTALDLKANTASLSTVARSGNYNDLINLPTTTAVDASTLSGTLAISSGGTGSTTKNFIDLSTDQTITGAKVFTTNGTYAAALTVSGNLVAPNIGSSSVVDFTHRIVSAATSSTFTKLIQFGTGGLSGSNTILNIGSGLSGANNLITIAGPAAAATTRTTINGAVVLPTLSGYIKGNGTDALTASSTIPSYDITGLIKKVNGNLPDVDGNVAISFGTVTTGTLANRPVNVGTNGNIYVVSADPNASDNGRTYISDGTNWNEVTSNQAATDARYVQLASPLTTNLTGYLKGNGTTAVSASATIPASDITGLIKKVNGNVPDADGNVAISFGTVFTGTLANRPVNAGTNGNIYVVSSDATTAENGRTFISDGTSWKEVTSNQSATDARYLKLAGGTLSGNLVVPSSTKITLTDAPVLNTDAVNKAYVDGITANLSGNATNVTGIVVGANGGTGVANTGKTITLGGNLLTGHALSFTTSGATTLSLPTSGTLATVQQVDAKELLSNKSTAVDLGNTSTSDDKYPSQKAVKTYVDGKVSAGASSIVGYTTALQTNGNNPGTNNVGIGPSTVSGIDGGGNTSIGSTAMQNNTAGWYNTTVGFRAMSNISTSGSNDNVAIGNAAAYYRGSGWDVNNQQLRESIYIGSMSRASANNQRNEIVIGYNAIGFGTNTIQLGNGAITDVKTNGKLTSGTVTYPNAHGTAGQVLSTTGSGALAWVTPAREVADEFIATVSQTSFTLTQTTSTFSKVKMFINGIRISNTAYSVTGTTVTYIAANNGTYVLTAGDRIQFDYIF